MWSRPPQSRSSSKRAKKFPSRAQLPWAPRALPQSPAPKVAQHLKASNKHLQERSARRSLRADQILHLIEHPIEGCWSAGAEFFAATALMASSSSLGEPGGGAVVRPASRRPRYLSFRF